MSRQTPPTSNMSDLRLVAMQSYVVDHEPYHRQYRPDDSSYTRGYYERQPSQEQSTPRQSARRQSSRQQSSRQQPTPQSRPYSMKTSKPASHNRQYDRRYYRQDPSPAPALRSRDDQTSSRITEVSAHGATPGDGAEFCSLTERSVQQLGPSTGGELWRLQSWAAESGVSVYSREFLEKMRRLGGT